MASTCSRLRSDRGAKSCCVALHVGDSSADRAADRIGGWRHTTIRASSGLGSHDGTPCANDRRPNRAAAAAHHVARAGRLRRHGHRHGYLPDRAARGRERYVADGAAHSLGARRRDVAGRCVVLCRDGGRVSRCRRRLFFPAQGVRRGAGIPVRVVALRRDPYRARWRCSRLRSATMSRRSCRSGRAGPWFAARAMWRSRR